MDRKVKLYARIARMMEALAKCKRQNNAAWTEAWERELTTLAEEHLPRGCGFDSGTSIDLTRSQPDRLVLHTEYHHMDAHGFYDGWTEHDIIVTPSLAHGCVIRVAGPDRDGFREYVLDRFDFLLNLEVDAHLDTPVVKPAA